MLKLKLQKLFSKEHGKDIRRRLTGNDITGRDIYQKTLQGKTLETREKYSTHRDVYITSLRNKNQIKSVKRAA